MSIGNVFVCGASQNGDWGEVASLRGRRILSLCGGHSSLIAITEGHHVEWISDAPAAQHEVEAVATDMEADALAFGDGHSLMVTHDGSVFAWGACEDGQLGQGNVFPADEPELIGSLSSSRVTSVAAGDTHSAAVTDAGELFTWGRSHEGQTGHGFKSKKAAALAQSNGAVQYAPKYVAAFLRSRVRVAACGTRFSVSVLEDGSVYTWGEGLCGQLGEGRITQREVPKRILDGSDDGHPFVDAVCGWGHTLARTDDGQVYAWGFNGKGQLGVGDELTRFQPVRLEEQDVEANAASLAEVRAAERRVAAKKIADRRAAEEKERDDEEAKKASEAALHGGAGDGGSLHGASHGSMGPDAARLRRTDRTHSGGSVADLTKSQWLAGAITNSLTMAHQDEEEERRKARKKRPQVEIPKPTPVWRYPERVLRATSIAAGAHHSVALGVDGMLYTWGCHAQGRLGLPSTDVEQQIANGDVTTTRKLNAVYPCAVTKLAGRCIGAIAASARDTMVVAGVELSAASPLSGETRGGTRLKLTGGGLEVLAYRDAAAARAHAAGELPPDEPISGVFVRFTRRSRVPPREGGDGKADSDDGEGKEEGKAGDVADEQIPEELLEKVEVVPATRPPVGQDGLACLTPPFLSPCDVVVEVLLCDDGDFASAEAVAGQARFSYYVPPVVRSAEPPGTPLEPGALLTLRGDGLFGCMASDPAAGAAARRFVAAVEAAYDAKLDAEEAAARGETVDAAAAAARAAGEGMLDPDGEHELPPQEGDTLRVRVALLLNGEPTGAEAITRGVYRGRYAVVAKNVASDEEEEDDEEEDDEDGGPPGDFTASVEATLPASLAAQLPTAVQEARKAANALDDCVLELSLAMAPNGVDFVVAPNRITTYMPAITRVEPASVPIGKAGAKLTVRGEGFVRIEGVPAKARFTVSTEGKEGGKSVEAAAMVDDARTLTCKVPKLPLPPRKERDPGTGQTKTKVPKFGHARYRVDVSVDGGATWVSGVTSAAAAADDGDGDGKGSEGAAEVSSGAGAGDDDRPRLAGEVGGPVGIHGYAVALGEATPSCGVSTGGTVLTIAAKGTGPVVFEAAPDGFAKVKGAHHDSREPVVCDTKANAWRVAMPAFEDPDVAEEAGGAGGAGGDEAEAEAPLKPSIDRAVTVKLLLNGRDTVAGSASFTYYAPEDVGVTAVAPNGGKKVVAGGGIVLSVLGLAIADPRHMCLRLSTADGPSVEIRDAEIDEEKTTMTIEALPAVFEKGMTVSASITVDGQYISPQVSEFTIH